MSQDIPGGPTREELAQFKGPAPGSAVSYKYTTVNTPDVAKSNEYPIVPFAPDKYDTIASIKQTVGSDKTDKDWGKKWVVPFTDADAQYLLRQEAQVKNANYERWLWQQYDITNPAEAWIFQQIAPEQFEKRKQLILYNQNLATKYALLRLYGVKSEEDLMLKYLVETQQIELPEGPVWDPKKWMKAQSGYDGKTDNEFWRKRYRAGMFSALKYPNEKQVGYMPGTNRADALGYDTDKQVQEQLFAGSNAWNKPYASYGQGPTWAPPESTFPYNKGAYGFGGREYTNEEKVNVAANRDYNKKT
jgi:hypothetical protein